MTYFVTCVNNSRISQFRTKWDETVRNCDTVCQQCISSFLFNLNVWYSLSLVCRSEDVNTRQCRIWFEGRGCHQFICEKLIQNNSAQLWTSLGFTSFLDYLVSLVLYIIITDKSNIGRTIFFVINHNPLLSYWSIKNTDYVLPAENQKEKPTTQLLIQTFICMLQSTSVYKYESGES